MENNLFELLDVRNQTQLNILAIISESQNWYSVHELSLRLNVVERSIQRYIHHLQETIDDYNHQNNSSIKLSYERYHGVLLESDSANNCLEIKNHIFENDETMKIFKKIMFEHFDSVKKYSLTYFVSENAVRKSVKKITKFLELYSLSLSKKSFQILGEEKRIRIIAYIIGWLSYKGASWPFDSVNQFKAYQTIDSFASAVGLTFSDIHRKQMAYMMAINLIRLRKNHVIELEPEWKNYVNIKALITTLPSMRQFIETYSIYVESELYFYALLMQMKSKIYESEELKSRIFGYHQQSQSDIYEATSLFVSSFHHHVVAVPNELGDRFFTTSFCAHLFCKIFSQLSVDIDGHSILDKPEYNYPILKENLTLFISQLHEKSQNNIFAEKEFLLQKYMLLFSSVSPLTHYEPTIKISLDSDLPFFINKHIISKLHDRFKYDYNILFLADYSWQLADIVLTNIPKTTENHSLLPYKIHLFDFPIKTRDYHELEHSLKMVAQQKSQISS